MKLKPTGTIALMLMSTGCLLAPAISQAQSGPVIWAVSSLQRVGQNDPAGSASAVQIKAGRGEYESYQIVVKAPGGGLSNVNVTVSDLTGPGGSVISKTSCTLYREQYVNVSPSSPNWGGSNQPGPPGMYADPLIPFVDPSTGRPLSGATLTAVPFNLSGGMNQPIWVDVLVPRTATPGAYSGTYTVTSNQGSVTGSVSLTVWSFTLPVKPSMMSSFLYWTASSLAADEELLRNRIQPIRPSSTSDESMLMSNYGLGSYGVPFYSGADVSSCTMSAAPSVSQFQQSASSQASGLYLYDYSADEIDNCPGLNTTLQQWAYNMHQAGIKNLVTMSPTPALYSDGSGSGQSAVDIWVMLPVMYDGAVSNVQYVQKKGDLTWSYNALVQDSYSPKWLIDFAPVNFRIQSGFISESLGLTGLLYWRIDDWSSDPWNQINNTGTFSSANYPGEGVFVYPGQQVGISGVAPSMRLKWLRDGTDDYEYVEMLKAKGQGSWALQQAQTVGLNWSTWTRDPNALQSVRDQLGAKLDQLYGGSTTPTAPPAPTTPSPANGATNVVVNTALSWTGSSSATSYDVYFGTTSSPSLVKNVTAASYTPSSPLANNTTYNWKIVAKNSGGSTSSSVWSFTTDTPTSSSPGTPTLTSPANNLTGVSLTPTVSWTSGGNTTSFDVYLGTTKAGTTSSTSYALSGLSAGTTYSWKVVANNSAGSTSSTAWSFTTAGTSTGPVNPTAASVTPSSGTGMSQTFQLVFSDGNGAASISGGGARINATNNGVNACWFYYFVSSNSITLSSDDTTTWSSATAGSKGTLQNSQCTLNAAGVTISSSGNTVKLSVPVTFTTAFAGKKTIYLYGQDSANVGTGYQGLGTWTVGATTTTTPTPTLPGKPTLTSPANGATGLSATPALSWTSGGNTTSYDVYQGTTKAGSTSGTSYTLSGLTTGTTYSWKVVANNASGSTSSDVWSFTTMAATPPPPAGFVAVSVSPASGSALSQTFQFVFSDPSGAAAITGAGSLTNAALDGAHSCWFWYDVGSNTISLASDDTTNWAAATAGSGGTIQNSQCTVNANGVKVSTSGTFLTLSVPVTFTSGFAGTKTVYLYAQDQGGLSTGFQPLGTFTIP